MSSGEFVWLIVMRVAQHFTGFAVTCALTCGDLRVRGDVGLNGLYVNQHVSLYFSMRWTCWEPLV